MSSASRASRSDVPEPQHPLDRRSRVAKQVLAALELGDRLAQARGVLVELAAPLRAAPRDVPRSSAGGQHPPDETAAPILVTRIGLVMHTPHRASMPTDRS